MGDKSRIASIEICEGTTGQWRLRPVKIGGSTGPIYGPWKTIDSALCQAAKIFPGVSVTIIGGWAPEKKAS